MTLLAGAAIAAVATPSFALSDKTDRVVVDQYRQKIDAARADPLIGRYGAAELDQAASTLPTLADDLDHNKADRVKAQILRIDTLIAAARAKAQTAMAQQRTAEATAANQQRLSDSEAQAAAARDKAASAQADAAKSQADAERAKAEAAHARQQLADLQMKQTALGATLVLQDVVFETGKADLKPGADARLRPLAQYLQTNTAVKVRIDGHTDAQGSDAMNQQLSQARAGAIRTALGAMGVDGSRIEAVGHGKSEPVADNKTAAGRQQNRRVEITLVGQQVGAPVASATP
jgi:outer membrane protein OmpA-like peptidoglycan-associated protein